MVMVTVSVEPWVEPWLVSMNSGLVGGEQYRRCQMDLAPERSVVLVWRAKAEA